MKRFKNITNRHTKMWVWIFDRKADRAFVITSDSCFINIFLVVMKKERVVRGLRLGQLFFIGTYTSPFLSESYGNKDNNEI